jgi:hypothetical protein
MTSVFTRFIRSENFSNAAEIFVKALDNRTVDGQATARSSAKANSHTRPNANVNGNCDGKGGGGKSSQTSVKAMLNRNGERTDPSSSPA